MTRDRQIIRLDNQKKSLVIIGAVLIALLTVITSIWTKYNLLEAGLAIPGVVNFILTDFLPPSVHAMPQLIPSLLDTIYMAIVSTVISGILALILALLCAETTAPSAFLRVLIRGFASALRNIPALAWALIFVPVFGIGKTIGVLALSIGALGSMTRLFTETIEEIDPGKVEALRATGASYWQTLRNGVIPQAVPGLLSWSLYNFELDVRASTIIGMVGGGGIGFFIQSTIKLFKYKQTSMAILIVALLILGVELISKRIREKVI